MQESDYLKGRSDLIKRFKQLPLLRPMEDQFLRRIMELSKIRKCEEGEIVTPEGAYDRWFYVLISGEVTIVKGGDEIARLRHPGDTFGELAVIDGEARSASVQAASDTVCLAVDASSMCREEMPERHVVYSVISGSLPRSWPVGSEPPTRSWFVSATKTPPSGARIP